MPHHDNSDKLRRLQRCNSMIHGKLATLFTRELDKEKRKHLITIVNVETSYDFSHAKVFISVFGNGAKRVVADLQKREPYFRHLLSSEIALRRIPTLKFELDASLDHVDHIEHLLAKLRQET